MEGIGEGVGEMLGVEWLIEEVQMSQCKGETCYGLVWPADGLAIHQ